MRSWRTIDESSNSSKAENRRPDPPALKDAEAAERWLAGLEPIGWRLGLERMRALCEALGNPQLRYATAHVVGTNGKTSVSRMIEGLLEASGVSAGSSVSPHLTAWRERINVGGRTLPEGAFLCAARRVAEAAAEVDAGLRAEQGRLTQFEIATAVAFVALADAGVEAAAIEAGLGGRLDASNVLDSELTVLTSVGLDHVEWLGEDEERIATEKLAVLRPGTVLIVGPASPEVRALARRRAGELDAELIEVGGQEHGSFRGLDLEIARRATLYMLARLRPDRAREDLDPARAAEIAAGIEIPGRLELWPGPPAVLFDVAHNPQGACALAAALPEVAAGRPVIACIALLADKDADGYVAALAPALDRVVCTELGPEDLRGGGRSGASSHPAAELAERFARAGVAAEAVPDPEAALRRLGELAGPERSLILVTGSHYLVARARDRRLWHH